MPAERRSFTATRPVKTERTHEENQERAYIAASRRSDRSLEARIESARRASEIHKKRTGRALRVTEQDVINEEMYEEEDDDLPTQYQRLNAHLHTTSVMFNKKLHDYIATQHGVRNMFMSQYQNPQFQQLGGQFSAQNSGAIHQTNNWLNPTMMPPQQFNSQANNMNSNGNQQSQPLQANASQSQPVRSSPYHVPQRSQLHQRSASIAVPAFDASVQQGTSTTQDGRRQSLPAQSSADGQTRPALSPTPTLGQPTSPHTDLSASPLSGSGQHTPHLHLDADTTTSNSFNPMHFPMGSQMFGGPNPLSMSLPPESQQFVGSLLDPNDPRTAMFMSGSEHLAQPFTPTYTYNPNYSPKALKSGSSITLSMPQTGIKSESIMDSCAPISSGLFTNDSLLTPGNEGYGAFFDFQSSDFAQLGDEQNNSIDQLVDGSSFVNWD